MRGFVFVALLAVAGAGEVRAQDAAAGEKVFGVCKACHQIGETAKNVVGPVLNGIIGRKAGSVAGYSYSAANKDSGITWDEATFREYIKDPKAKMPGTKMIYAGLKDEQKTSDLDRLSQAVRCRREEEIGGSAHAGALGGRPLPGRSRLPFSALISEICCLAERLRLKATLQPKDRAMAHNYAINDDVLHQMQGPQGRAVVKQPSVYTIVTCLPIEADGRPRYRIKSKTENVERVVTEEQISRLG